MAELDVFQITVPTIQELRERDRRAQRIVRSLNTLIEQGVIVQCSYPDGDIATIATICCERKKRGHIMFIQVIPSLHDMARGRAPLTLSVDELKLSLSFIY